jgi:hypothetical protein
MKPFEMEMKKLKQKKVIDTQKQPQTNGTKLLLKMARMGEAV